MLIAPVTEAQHDVWPIGHSGYALQFIPAPSEPDLAALVAALLTACPFLHQQPSLSKEQQSLLDQISRAIVEQRQFDVIIGRIDVAFAEAFPGCRARFVLYEVGNKRKILHTIFGQKSDWLPVADDENLNNVQETTLLPEDTQLILPVKTAEGEVRAILQVAGSSVEDLRLKTAVFNLIAGYLGVALSYQQLLEQAWQRAQSVRNNLPCYRICPCV